MAQPVYLDNGKIVGNVDGVVFTKTVNTGHQLQKPPAWCVDAVIIHKLKGLGVKRIIIRNIETRKAYMASIELFDQKSFPIERRFGKQLCLMLSEWTETAC